MCNFIQRWWHKRLRRIDLQVMLPVIKSAAEKSDKSAINAWLKFMEMPGQEHWRCECARQKKNYEGENFLNIGEYK